MFSRALGADAYVFLIACSDRIYNLGLAEAHGMDYHYILVGFSGSIMVERSS